MTEKATVVSQVRTSSSYIPATDYGFLASSSVSCSGDTDVAQEHLDADIVWGNKPLSNTRVIVASLRRFSRAKAKQGGITQRRRAS